MVRECQTHIEYLYISALLSYSSLGTDTSSEFGTDDSPGASAAGDFVFSKDSISEEGPVMDVLERLY